MSDSVESAERLNQAEPAEPSNPSEKSTPERGVGVDRPEVRSDDSGGTGFQVLRPLREARGRPCVVSITFPVGTSLRAIQDLAIQAILDYTNDNRKAAAALLNIHRRTIARHWQRKAERQKAA